MDQVLAITCPTIIYPYLRANIADMILRAGFPPAHLAEINFEAYYQDRIQQQKAQNQKTETQTELGCPCLTAGFRLPSTDNEYYCSWVPVPGARQLR